MVNAQEWLDEKHPLEKRKEITSLSINKRGLEGSLDLRDFTNLKKIKVDWLSNKFSIKK